MSALTANTADRAPVLLELRKNVDNSSDHALLAVKMKVSLVD